MIDATPPTSSSLSSCYSIRKVSVVTLALTLTEIFITVIVSVHQGGLFMPGIIAFAVTGSGYTLSMITMKLSSLSKNQAMPSSSPPLSSPVLEDSTLQNGNAGEPKVKTLKEDIDESWGSRWSKLKKELDEVTDDNLSKYSASEIIQDFLRSTSYLSLDIQWMYLKDILEIVPEDGKKALFDFVMGKWEKRADSMPLEKSCMSYIYFLAIYLELLAEAKKEGGSKREAEVHYYEKAKQTLKYLFEITKKIEEEKILLQFGIRLKQYLEYEKDKKFKSRCLLNFRLLTQPKSKVFEVNYQHLRNFYSLELEEKPTK